MDDYLNSYIDNANNFYIHLKSVHVGQRGSAGIYDTMNSKRTDLSAQLKAQYIELMSKNLKIPNGTLKTLSNSMNITEEELITKIDNQILNDLQKDINVSKLESLFEIVKNKNLNQCLKEAVRKENIEKLNEAFNILNECLALLEGKNGSLGAALLKSIEDNPANFSEIGGKLLSELENWKNNNNYKTIKKQSLDISFKQLKNLGIALSTGKFKTSKNDLSENGIVTLISNGLISTSIAEGLAFSMKAKADSILNGVVAQAVGRESYNSEILNKNISGGKTDIRLPNVKIKIEGYEDEIKLNIGVSSKFFTGQTFLGNTENLTGAFHSGSGGTLKEVLLSIFPIPQERYLAYNYMYHFMYISEMNNIILKRQFLRLFSTMGSSKDFAQYMLINGKIVSIWRIIQYVINTELGESRSMKGEQTQGVVLHIKGRENFKDKTIEPVKDGESVLEAAWRRSRRQNKLINSATIHAELHLKNLAKAYSSLDS